MPHLITKRCQAALILGLLGLSTQLAARPCRAELPASAPVNAEPSPEAREQFGIGVSLLQDPDGARYEEAFQAFMRAYTATPSWKILGNLGLAALKIERYTDGIEAYDRYLAQAGGQLDPAEREQVKRDLSIMKATSATITLKISGASGVSVDDTRVRTVGGPVVNAYAVPASGTLVLKLAAGHHSIKAAGEGKSGTLQIDVKSGEAHEYPITLAEGAATSNAAPATTAPTTSGNDPKTDASLAPASHGSGMRTAGLVIGGVGVAALIGGGVLAILGSSAKSDLEKRCPNNVCSYGSDAERQSFESDRDALKSKGTLTTVFLIGGGVLAATGATLFVLGGPSKEAQVSAVVAPGLLGLSAQGAF